MGGGCGDATRLWRPAKTWCWCAALWGLQPQWCLPSSSSLPCCKGKVCRLCRQALSWHHWPAWPAAGVNAPLPASCAEHSCRACCAWERMVPAAVGSGRGWLRCCCCSSQPALQRFWLRGVNECLGVALGLVGEARPAVTACCCTAGPSRCWARWCAGQGRLCFDIADCGRSLLLLAIGAAEGWIVEDGSIDQGGDGGGGRGGLEAGRGTEGGNLLLLAIRQQPRQTDNDVGLAHCRGSGPARQVLCNVAWKNEWWQREQAGGLSWQRWCRSCRSCGPLPASLDMLVPYLYVCHSTRHGTSQLGCLYEL